MLESNGVWQNINNDEYRQPIEILPDDCPLNSFVYVTRKISETKASERVSAESWLAVSEGDQTGITMTADRLRELRQIHLSFASQADPVDARIV